MSEKRNGKLFFQRRGKCGRIQTQLAEIWGWEALRRNGNPVETRWWSQGHRCKIKCEKVYFNKSPLADKNQTHKTGICFTRVTTALQCPAGVEKPSEILRGEGSITDPLQGHWLSRVFIQERSSHSNKYRESREIGISIFQEKMQKTFSFPCRNMAGKWAQQSKEACLDRKLAQEWHKNISEPAK